MAFSDYTDVLGKWLSVPFGLLVVIVGASVLNLENYLQEFAHSTKNDTLNFVMRYVV